MTKGKPVDMKWITDILKIILCVLMTVMIIAVGYGVFTRYVLNDAASWTGELSGYVLVWITFLGSAWAVFEKGHMSVENFVEKFPPSLYFFVKALINVALIIFACLVTYYGTILAVNSIHDKVITLPVTKGFVYAVIPVSGLLMLIGFVRDLVQLFINSGPFKKHSSEPNTVQRSGQLRGGE